MADLIGITASAAGGGSFGLLGTALGRVAGFVEKRQTMAHEERRWSHEVKLLELQQLAAVQETEAELAIARTEGSWAGRSRITETATFAATAATLWWFGDRSAGLRRGKIAKGRLEWSRP